MSSSAFSGSAVRLLLVHVGAPWLFFPEQDMTLCHYHLHHHKNINTYIVILRRKSISKMVQKKQAQYLKKNLILILSLFDVMNSKCIETWFTEELMRIFTIKISPQLSVFNINSIY